MVKAKIIRTTLGDLILALTEEVAPHVANEKESYRIVAVILADLLNAPHRASVRNPDAPATLRG